MEGNKGSKRSTARQQRKRADRKKKLERRQNKLTRKALRYTMPKNTEIMQANLVSIPKISRAFVNSSSSNTINMLNNVNSDFVRRDTSDRQEATQIGKDLLLSMIKANIETSAINDGAVRTAITNTKDEVDKSVDGLISALAAAAGNEIKSAAESVKQMVEALRNSQIENDQQRLMLDNKSAEFDKQRELDARAVADEMADKIKAEFGQIKDTFSKGAAGLKSALDSLADSALNLHNLINSSQFNMNNAFKDLSLLAEAIYTRQLANDPNPPSPPVTIYYCESCFGLEYQDCNAENRTDKKKIVKVTAEAIECLKNFIKTDENSHPKFNHYIEAPDIEAKGFMITPKGKICFPNQGPGTDESGKEFFWTLDPFIVEDAYNKSMIRLFNNKLPPEWRITEFTWEGEQWGRVLSACILYCTQKEITKLT